jgi:hypothetical protein
MLSKRSSVPMVYRFLNRASELKTASGGTEDWDTVDQLSMYFMFFHDLPSHDIWVFAFI